MSSYFFYCHPHESEDPLDNRKRWDPDLRRDDSPLFMCIFCQIIAGKIPAEKIYEDEQVLAILNIHPNNFGHSLVMPKKHCENLFDADEKTLCFLIKAVKKISLAVKQTTRAEGINIGINNGVVAGQVVPHFHIHVIPRFSDDGFVHWQAKEYRAGEKEKMGERIRKEIEN